MDSRAGPARGHVVVGLEHGRTSGLVSLAADEAELRGRDLAVVTVLPSPRDLGQNVLSLRRTQLQQQATALQQLREAAAGLRVSHPRLEVTTYCLGDAELGPDREPLRWADLAVIGTRQRYGRQALVLESVSWLLLNSSRCPILVVPEDAPAKPRTTAAAFVLIGIEDHPADAAVVRAGYTEAAARRCEALLFLAYTRRSEETAEQGRDRAAAILAGFAQAAPAGVPVSTAAIEDDLAPALLPLAHDAVLLVLGDRTVLEALPCPVLVVPGNPATARGGPVLGLGLAEPRIESQR